MLKILFLYFSAMVGLYRKAIVIWILKCLLHTRIGSDCVVMGSLDDNLAISYAYYLT